MAAIFRQILAQIGAGENVMLEAAKRFKVTGGTDFVAEAPWVDITGSTKVRMGGGYMEINSSGVRIDTSHGKHHIGSPAIFLHGTDGVQVVTKNFHVYADEIVLMAGGASIKIAGGKVEIVGAPIHLNP